MSLFYRRTTPGTRENWGAGLVAAGLGLGVASISFYLVRIFLSREALEPLEPLSEHKSGPGDERPSVTGAEADGG